MSATVLCFFPHFATTIAGMHQLPSLFYHSHSLFLLLKTTLQIHTFFFILFLTIFPFYPTCFHFLSFHCLFPFFVLLLDFLTFFCIKSFLPFNIFFHKHTNFVSVSYLFTYLFLFFFFHRSPSILWEAFFLVI